MIEVEILLVIGLVFLGVIAAHLGKANTLLKAAIAEMKENTARLTTAEQHLRMMRKYYETPLPPTEEAQPRRETVKF